MRNLLSKPVIYAVVAVTLAASAGFLAATALGIGAATPTRTVTITLQNGATGPQGPIGPSGPPGTNNCPDGFTAGELVINHPGGQTVIWTCLKD